MFQKKYNRPFLIAGPCSAETEEQIMPRPSNSAACMPRLGQIDLFRAGVWKPRTRPGAFEGNGAVALPWLRRVKAETGLRTTIEVANGNQVYEALKHGVDVLWIGAPHHCQSFFRAGDRRCPARRGRAGAGEKPRQSRSRPVDRRHRAHPASRRDPDRGHPPGIFGLHQIEIPQCAVLGNPDRTAPPDARSAPAFATTPTSAATAKTCSK